MPEPTDRIPTGASTGWRDERTGLISGGLVGACPRCGSLTHDTHPDDGPGTPTDPTEQMPRFTAAQLAQHLATFGRGRCNWLPIDTWLSERRAPTRDDLCPKPAARRVEVYLPAPTVAPGTETIGARTILTSLCHEHDLVVTLALTTSASGGASGSSQPLGQPPAGWHPVHSQVDPSVVLYWRRQVHERAWLTVRESGGRWEWRWSPYAITVASGTEPSQYEAMIAADRHISYLA